MLPPCGVIDRAPPDRRAPDLSPKPSIVRTLLINAGGNGGVTAPLPLVFHVAFVQYLLTGHSESQKPP